MKNIRLFYTIDVLFGKLPTPKVNRCLHMDIRYSTFGIRSHVTICLREKIRNSSLNDTPEMENSNFFEYMNFELKLISCTNQVQNQRSRNKSSKFLSKSH